MEGAITPPMRSDGSSSVRGWEQASRAGPGQCNVVALSEAVLGQEKAVEILACLIWIRSGCWLLDIYRLAGFTRFAALPDQQTRTERAGTSVAGAAKSCGWE